MKSNLSYPGFIQGWRTSKESNIFFLFLVLIKGIRRWDEFKIFSRDSMVALCVYRVCKWFSLWWLYR